MAYREYKKFDNVKFHDGANNFTFNKFDVGTFKETIFNIFDKHAPIKQKQVQLQWTPGI